MLRFYSMVGMLLFLCSTLTFAQSRQITGRVTDQKDGSGLPGVTVKVKGTSNGTVTNPNGSYKLDISGQGISLIFSFVGYSDQEIAVGNQNVVNVNLTVGNKDLSEVIVVGYGTQSKQTLTGSVTKLSAKEIENQPVVSFESAIQGKAPGVVVESGSGKLGQAIKIRIRGTSSISANSQPLYVLDGVPIQSTSLSDINNDDTNPLADINPNDIESVEVLKDAAASAIYGARASNGVVLITTKKGKSGEKTRIELNASSSWGKPTRKRGFLNAKQYVDLLTERAKNDAKTGVEVGDFATEAEALDFFMNDQFNGVVPAFKSLSKGTDWRNNAVNTNWEDLSFRNAAPSQQLDLSASGGNDKTRFFISGYFANQNAIVINNNFKRYGGRLNLDHKATDKLSFGVNLAVSRTELDRISNDNTLSTPGELVALSPITPERDSTGKITRRSTYANGLYDAQFNTNTLVTFRTVGNVFLNYKFLPSLTFRSELGTDILNMNEDQYIGKLASDGVSTGGGASASINQNVVLNTNNYFTYAPTISADHTFSATVGMSYLQNNFYAASSNGQNFPSDLLKNIAAAATITAGSSETQKYTFLSYFLRANYAYKNKYLASFSVRADGSSRFGPNNRYGTFPAGSLGWVVSEEDFLKGNSVLNYLKIRTSYGLTGNAEIGNNRFLTLLEPTNYPGLPGFRPLRIGNADLKWEKTGQFDVGVEFGLLDNRISGEVDYYNKQTSDLLLQANVPYMSGYTFQYKNIGNMSNKGIEIGLTTRNIVSRNFNWTTNLNLAYNKNLVKDIKGQIIESPNGEQRAVEGEPIGAFFMVKYAGVDPQTGDPLYLDKDGKTTKDFAQGERQVVGKSNPDWTGGFTNTFSAYGFDLSVFFTFVQGNNIYNRAGIYMSSGFANGLDNQTTEVLDRWQKPGDITNEPRLSGYYLNGVSETSTRWLYDGSYIRLKSLTLGYNLPKKALSALHISNLRFYVAGFNLWTKTKYIADPEINTDVTGNIAGGVDFYTVPQAKQVTVGLNVKF